LRELAAAESISNVLETRSFNVCCSEKKLIDLIFEMPLKITGEYMFRSLVKKKKITLSFTNMGIG
jgi:hypothetical protein